VRSSKGLDNDGNKADDAHRTKPWDRDISNLEEYFRARAILRNIRRSNPRRDARFEKFAGRTPAKSCGG
jgi:hypothetical protein